MSPKVSDAALKRGRKATMSDCEGCRNDFYNGHNPLGVKECWSLKEARVVTLYQIGWWTQQDRAENFQKVKKPHCWHAPGQVALMEELPSHLRRSREV
jgi:hypothetical protein